VDEWFELKAKKSCSNVRRAARDFRLSDRAGDSTIVELNKNQAGR
jgi:hypothetical protein